MMLLQRCWNALQRRKRSPFSILYIFQNTSRNVFRNFSWVDTQDKLRNLNNAYAKLWKANKVFIYEELFKWWIDY